MSNQTQSSTLEQLCKKIETSDTSRHLARAAREILLAMQSTVDAIIETKTRRTETEVEKVTIE